ncbi:hypothetical protein NQ314_005620 [Rhamnusium bicolor]|uniref:PiggyBac transposable element-derived protein domain-containing protein n=1 Tax=Rhamnusium bicolor TaxID=1586634 RepID=A0AAV8ZH11_9CUCU|nr:hypothetical protein NQ314_005620 [Rhamnusium bicolor]
MAFGSKRGLTDDDLYELLMNSDAEEERDFDLYGKFGGYSSAEDEVDENIENIASIINSQRQLDITGSVDVAIVAELEPPDVTEPKNIVNWQNIDLKPTLHEFDNAKSGVQLQLTQSPSPLDIFESFFTNDFTQKIVDETNRYHDYTITESEIPNASRLSLLMPLVHKQRLNDYWSKDLIIETPMFHQVMPRDRYLSLLSKMHFCDNTNVNANDRLFKIRLVIDHFRNVQYIPSKRHRFGIKFFVLADCETGYVLDFIVYTGSETDMKVHDPVLKIGGNIVMTLMEPYLNAGHILYVDNWYNSPVLAEALFKKKTHICGTVKPNRLNMPTFKKKMEVGEVQYFSSDTLLALQWQDKREVTMLTSCHSGCKIKATNSRGKEVEKPKCIIDYNKNIVAIDRSDMLLSSTESVRKASKCHSVYKTVTGENIPLLEFQKKLIKEIFEKYCVVKSRQTSRRTDEGHNSMRLVDRHFPTCNETCPVKNKRIPKVCVVCSKQKIKKNTVYRCDPCNVPLCVVGCFERYHTLLRF